MNFIESPASWPLLEALQIVPLVAAFLLWKLKGTPAATVAIIATVLEMILAILLYIGFDTKEGTMQFANQFSLLGLPYHAAADGISVLFVLLTALLSLLAVFFIIFRDLH